MVAVDDRGAGAGHLLDRDDLRVVVVVTLSPVVWVERFERSDEQCEPELDCLARLDLSRAAVSSQHHRVSFLRKPRSALAVVAPGRGDASCVQARDVPRISRPLQLAVQARVHVANPGHVVHLPHVPAPAPLLRSDPSLARHAHHVLRHVGSERDLQAKVPHSDRLRCLDLHAIVHVAVWLHRGATVHRHGLCAARRLPSDSARLRLDELRRGVSPRHLAFGCFHQEHRGPGQDLPRLGIDAVYRQRVPAADALGQTGVANTQFTTQTPNGSSFDPQGCEGRRDLVVEPDSRVQPFEARHAPQLANAGVFEHVLRDIQRQLHCAVVRTLNTDHEIALVSADWQGLGQLHAKPQRLHLPFGDRDIFGHGPAEPVSATHVGAAEGRGGYLTARRGPKVAKLDGQPIDRLAGRIHAHLEYVEFSTLCLAAKLVRRPTPDPAQRQIVLHPDRARPVFREEQVGAAVVLCDECIGLCLRGNDLHWVEPVELAPRLKLHDFGLRQRLPPRTMALDPGSVGRAFEGRIFRPIAPPLRVVGVGEVIDEVVARRGGRLEHDVAALAVGFHDHPVAHLLARLRIHDHHVFLLRRWIAASPGNPRPDRARRFPNTHQRPMVAERLRPTRIDDPARQIRAGCCAERARERYGEQVEPKLIDHEWFLRAGCFASCACSCSTP